MVQSPAAAVNGTSPKSSQKPVSTNADKHLSAILEAAIAYARRGWSIIPVVGKQPAGFWRPFQSRAADETTVKKLFSKNNITGVAVITGTVSGSLAIRDFDRADAYHAWVKANPADAAILPTVQTARGCHVYAAIDDEQFIDYGDGELRGDSGHYTLLPPSAHPDGGAYTWTVPLPPIGQALPRMPDTLLRPWARHAQQMQADPCIHIACATSANPTPEAVHRLIVQSLPAGPGQRNRAIFDFARALKGVMSNATADELHPYMEQWHAQALPLIRTKDFDESWDDFVVAWGTVKYARGASLRSAVAKAEDVQLVGVAAGYTGTLRRLAQLCAELQAQAGDRPFFLGCRTVPERVCQAKNDFPSGVAQS
jgi:hypothetical protein